MNRSKGLGWFDILLSILSFYLIGALVLDTFYTLDPEVSKVIHVFDLIICAIFFAEFCYRLISAESKLEYLKWGWLDLLSSIPMVEELRGARIFRLIRLIRVIKAYRTLHKLIQHLFQNRVKGTLNAAILFATLMILFSSVSILIVENVPESNIKTAEDALWWAFVTITTVGYGDRYPVTTEGRLIAAVLMIVGVGLFGTFTAYVSSWFIGGAPAVAEMKSEEKPHEQNENSIRPIPKE
ncbi:MAG: ion transporter [Chloroherpetonaceae bacterium]|nr:ion transporter [Chloroherpetonaceae bacterium]